MNEEATEPATNYHESINDLRRALMRASQAWQTSADRLMPQVTNESPDVERVALTAALMAANYSYTLAAVLGIAEKSGNQELAQHLAFEADEIMTNGDFDDHNKDVTAQTPAPDDEAA